MRENKPQRAREWVVEGFLSRSLPDPIRELISDETLADKIRGWQVTTIKQTTPMMLLSNMIATLLTVWVLYGTVDPRALFGWTGVMSLTMLAGASNIRFRWRIRSAPYPRKSTGRININAIVIALIWGAMPILFFDAASVSQKIFITSIVSGMMAIGTAILGFVPSAAILYCGAIAACATITLLMSRGDEIILAVGVLLITYWIALVRIAIAQGRRFVSRFADAHELKEQRATIGMLLKDFENSSSDWMWETSADGKITNPSARFCESIGKDAQAIQGRTFGSFVSLPQAKGSSELTGTPLAKKLSSALVFRDHIVQIDTRIGPRWWSLTGKPMVDSEGLLIGFRGTASDIHEVKSTQDKLNTMALYDQLTGFPNRNRFHELLAQALKRQSALGSNDKAGVAVIYIDLDRFKIINNRLGHSFGDALLKEAANRLETCVGEEDQLSRFGGDEFGLFLRSENCEADAVKMAEQMLVHLSRPYLIQGRKLTLSGSMGIALSKDVAGDCDRLFRNADLALSLVKSEGGGQYKLFQPDMGQKLEDRRRLEIDLREAVSQQKFELYYQPIIGTQTGAIRGYEALIRWQHPKRGNVPREKFMPLAEETGLIKEIGEWALEKACRDATSWKTPHRVAVNVSHKQIVSQRLLLKVVKTLEKTQLAPERLELEIHEVCLRENSDKVRKLLTELRKMGLTISLDDFGGKRSSISALVRFPIDQVKIDGRLIRSAGTKSEDRTLIRSIVGLAESLKIGVTAEGIESEDQLEMARSEGCGSAQGYWIQRPQNSSCIPGLKSNEAESCPKAVAQDA